MEPVYSTPLGCINKALVFSRTGAHEQHKTPALVTYTNIRTRAMRTKLRSAVLIGSILLAFLSAPLVTSTSVETKASRYLKDWEMPKDSWEMPEYFSQGKVINLPYAGILTPSTQPLLLTSSPTDNPTSSPRPSANPTVNPTNVPTEIPTTSPTKAPTSSPSVKPTNSPSRALTKSPTLRPSSSPSDLPSFKPSTYPSDAPSTVPSNIPSVEPSPLPSLRPSSTPSLEPSMLPSLGPTKRPTGKPSASPSLFPSSMPSQQPTENPSMLPSSTPTFVPSALPTISSNPTRLPSKSPSESPSKLPSSSPSFSKQELTFFLLFRFDDLDNFEERAKPRGVLERETAEVIMLALNGVHNGEDFDVVAVLKDKSPNAEENVRSGLEVQIQIFVSVRSAIAYDTKTLQDSISTAFDTMEKRKNFIVALQNQDTTFNRINEVEVKVDDKEVEIIEQGTTYWVILGAGIGGGAVVLSLLALFVGYRRKQRKRNSYSPQPKNPIKNEFIEVSDMDDNDISTMGPVDVGGGNMFGAFNDEAQNDSMLSAGYDYKMRYGGAGDMPSVSTAGGTKSGFGPYALADDLTQDGESRVRIDSEDVSNVSNIQDDLSLFQEDDSFDRMYGEDERIDVIAPPGKLGVVIDNPTNSVPMVHAIRETSVLADRVRIGDRLVAVDGEDTTDMSAIAVSKLISSNMNARRHMVFMRNASPN